MTTPFETHIPRVENNDGLRLPQREVYSALAAYAADTGVTDREVGIILPVGCGKSGCIALAPFAFRAKRALVVAPGLTIANQLLRDFDPAQPQMFYIKSGSLPNGPFPELAEIRGTETNREDLTEAHVVVTNIQQLQGQDNRWLQDLSSDFFDLILFDEGHHNVATSWEILKGKFPQARIVNFSATPLRADGQLMAGRILYSYPVYRAIQEGYVKSLKAVVLNPSTLRYVRRKDNVEVDVTLEEVRQLGEVDADFRRSIVTSKETLNTIVDASIRELQKLRQDASDDRLKIIASALNFEHCQQIVTAYRERGLRADYVHSREDGDANKQVLTKLNNHELDVIVQVRKLGEGFDHRHLAVAAVFSVFSNLSPFVQFVGRIMRVVKENSPRDPVNRGTVVFHSGANVARRWEDFQSYSAADQEYFDQLLPIEGLDFSSASEIEVEPVVELTRQANPIEVRGQTRVHLEEIPLLQDDPDALQALRATFQRLKGKGYSAEQIREVTEKELQPVPVTKQRARRAKRQALPMRVRTAAARILNDRGINPEGRQYDKKRLDRSNLVTLIATINDHINAAVGRGAKERHEFTQSELDTIDSTFDQIVDGAINEYLDVQS